MKVFFAKFFVFIVLCNSLYLFSQKAYDYNINKYEKKCKEIFQNSPVEILVLFSAKHIYTITSNEPYRISVNITQLDKHLKDNKEEISDLVFIIHNHLIPGGFSKNDGDYAFFIYLTNHGFRGLFCIWFQNEISNILIYRPKEKK